ncbi:hypothetical protein A2V71_01200 [Candidatus Berkelbacteria bacterium RBG_13_40_8]|uniref:Type II secretion system protein GspG C-terminal domain-containing protein n=1 Tax=Candidatus Berkelbacteria bacterium RBG_13_40_8 TaxID=1797467 RepID=A0A1F5DQE9_9BACT|nr:MAG: hypothetical protein A2V71_01200 [Candidatus Berkelbacteria bacterium RBG_13_40_8]
MPFITQGKTNWKFIIIVIVVVAIVGGGVWFLLTVRSEKSLLYRESRNATRFNQMNAIESVLYSYAVDHNGNFPDCVTETVTDVTTCIELISEKYISSFPVPPQAPTEKYMIQKEGMRIKITSTAQEAIEDGILISR